MQKARKSSLSPCYSTNNKENLPIDNFNTPFGLSFKNLEEVRKKKVTQVLFDNSTPKPHQDTKRKNDQSKTDKSVD